MTTPLDPAVDGEFDVAHHAPAEGIDLGGNPGRCDPLDRIRVGGRYCGKAGLDAMDPGFGQRLGDPQLVVGGELDSGLLLAVAQRDIMNLEIGRQMENFGDLGQVVPGAGEPLVGLPRLVGPLLAPHPIDRTIVHGIRSRIDQSKQDRPCHGPQMTA